MTSLPLPVVMVSLPLPVMTVSFPPFPLIVKLAAEFAVITSLLPSTGEVKVVDVKGRFPYVKLDILPLSVIETGA
jgi:hypothetical protein